MKCCAVENNQKPARGTSGLRPNCTATLVGFFIGDRMAQIKLTQGKYAIVDDENYEWLNQWKWFAIKNSNTYYAGRKDGDDKTIRMHRQILGAKKGEISDHKNRNGLDNRLCNLRLCTITQNARNKRPITYGSSKYKGVSWRGKNRKWQAKITSNYKCLKIGYFENEIDAAIAYDIKAGELFGEFAYLNFPEGKNNENI